eukprot:97930_1
MIFCGFEFLHDNFFFFFLVHFDDGKTKMPTKRSLRRIPLVRKSLRIELQSMDDPIPKPKPQPKPKPKPKLQPKPVHEAEPQELRIVQLSTNDPARNQSLLNIKQC